MPLSLIINQYYFQIKSVSTSTLNWSLGYIFHQKKKRLNEFKEIKIH